MSFEDFHQSQGLMRGMRILVVDDEALIALLIKDELNDAGAEVVGPVASVDDALALIGTACRAERSGAGHQPVWRDGAAGC